MPDLIQAYQHGLVTVHSWFNGDRASVEIRMNVLPDGMDTIVVWHDDEVAELFESGFVQPGKSAEKSFLEYAESRGFWFPRGFYVIQTYAMDDNFNEINTEDINYDPRLLTYFRSMDKLKKEIDRIVRFAKEDILFIEWRVWFDFPAGVLSGRVNNPDLIFRVGPDGIVRYH